MKLHRKIALSLLLFVLAATAQAESPIVGSDVLANCHGFFAKGKVKKMYKDHYVINFYKDARPIHCPPFSWNAMFVVPYQPVDQYVGKLNSDNGFLGSTVKQVLEVGDTLKVAYKASFKGQFFAKKYTVIVEIKEINSNGSAQLEPIDGEIEAQQVFRRWVGTNYVTLDFSSSLTADKLTILKVEKIEE
jgi:hypothetical protein